MNREEFLKRLDEALQGKVSANVISENIDYYDTFILQEVRKGKRETDVIAGLGNPRILAQTIIDTADNEWNVSREKSRYVNRTYDGEKNGYGNGNRKETDECNYKGQDREKFAWKRHDYGEEKQGYQRVYTGRRLKWLLIGIVAVTVLVLIGMVWLIGGIIAIVAPILVPVLLVVLIIKIMRRNR